jgi:hypothetical protein
LARNGRKANGFKAGKYSNEGDRIEKVFALISAKSEANGCLVTVDFREKGFYSSFTH